MYTYVEYIAHQVLSTFEINQFVSQLQFYFQLQLSILPARLSAVKSVICIFACTLFVLFIAFHFLVRQPSLERPSPTLYLISFRSLLHSASLHRSLVRWLACSLTHALCKALLNIINKQCGFCFSTCCLINMMPFLLSFRSFYSFRTLWNTTYAPQAAKHAQQQWE